MELFLDLLNVLKHTSECFVNLIIEFSLFSDLLVFTITPFNASSLHVVSQTGNKCNITRSFESLAIETRKSLSGAN